MGLSPCLGVRGLLLPGLVPTVLGLAGSVFSVSCSVGTALSAWAQFPCSFYFVFHYKIRKSGFL